MPYIQQFYHPLPHLPIVSSIIFYIERLGGSYETQPRAYNTTYIVWLTGYGVAAASAFICCAPWMNMHIMLNIKRKIIEMIT